MQRLSVDADEAGLARVRSGMLLPCISPPLRVAEHKPYDLAFGPRGMEDWLGKNELSSL